MNDMNNIILKYIKDCLWGDRDIDRAYYHCLHEREKVKLRYEAVLSRVDDDSPRRQTFIDAKKEAIDKWDALIERVLKGDIPEEIKKKW